MKNNQVIGIADELRNAFFVREASSDRCFDAVQSNIHE
jgi:hypothetical protein